MIRAAQCCPVLPSAERGCPVPLGAAQYSPVQPMHLEGLPEWQQPPASSCPPPRWLQQEQPQSSASTPGPTAFTPAAALARCLSPPRHLPDKLPSPSQGQGDASEWL